MDDEQIKKIFRPNKNILCKAKREKLINENAEIRSYLENRYIDLTVLDQILFCILSDIESSPKCKICGQPAEFISINRGFKQTCKKTSCKREKIKRQLLDKYGVDNIAKKKSVKEKISKSLKSRTTEEKKLTLEKTQKTCLDRYGVTNNLHISDIEQTIKREKHIELWSRVCSVEKRYKR